MKYWIPFQRRNGSFRIYLHYMKNKMKKIFLIFFALSSISANAQISITVDDLLDVGDSVMLAAVDSVPAGFSPGMGGANMHWDFSDLIMDTINTLEFLDPATTPYGSSFPASNIALQGLVEDLGAEGWAYATRNMFVFQIDGFAGTYDIFEDVVAPFNPPEVMFDFPLNYLDSMDQTSVVDIRIESPEPPADSIRLKVVTSVRTEVDAWGELITPTWTGQVLRIRDVRTTIDTVWVKFLFFWAYLESSVSVSHTYKYMANDMGYAVLQFNSDSSDTEYSGINYLVPEDVGTRDNKNELSRLRIFPNPATDELNIGITDTDISSHYSLLLYDMYGRMIKTLQIASATENFRMDVSGLKAGVYQLILRKNGEISGAQKVVVR